MKTQMRFQKIFMIVSLVLAAFGVVYALIFCSGVFNQINQVASSRVAGSENFKEVVQAANDKLLTLGVILVVINVLPFIASSQKRRNYYITNYIAAGIVVVYDLIYIIMLGVILGDVGQAFNGVDLATAESRFTLLRLNVTHGDWNNSTWMMTIGYVFIGILVADIVVHALNIIWKVLLMKGEKALLAQGCVKEVV